MLLCITLLLLRIICNTLLLLALHCVAAAAEHCYYSSSTLFSSSKHCNAPCCWWWAPPPNVDAIAGQPSVAKGSVLQNVHKRPLRLTARYAHAGLAKTIQTSATLITLNFAPRTSKHHYCLLCCCRLFCPLLDLVTVLYSTHRHICWIQNHSVKVLESCYFSEAL